MAELFQDKAALERICRQYGIRRLSLFGSHLKGTARPDSDIDLLVEFEPSKVPGLLRLSRIELELSALLGGRKADLRTQGDISPRFRDQVVASAQAFVFESDLGCGTLS